MEGSDFGALYARHAPYARKLLRQFGVRAADIDDAVQDAFVRIHRSLGGFEQQAKLETWIYAICWRVAAEYRRRARRERAGGAVEQSSSDVPELAPTERLHASLGSLDGADRDLLVLHELGELSISALSRMTGSARATVRRRLEDARRAVALDLSRNAKARTEGERRPADRVDDVDPQELARLAECADDREYVCAEYGVARYGHMVVACWRGANDRKGMAILAKVMLAAAADAVDGFTYLSVIEPSSALPDADARRLSAWLIAKAAAAGLRAIAFITLSPELVPIVPQFVNTWSFLSGSKIDIRFFDAVRPGLEWLTPLTPGESLPDLLEHCEGLRRKTLACGRLEGGSLPPRS